MISFRIARAISCSFSVSWILLKKAAAFLHRHPGYFEYVEPADLDPEHFLPEPGAVAFRTGNEIDEPFELFTLIEIGAFPISAQLPYNAFEGFLAECAPSVKIDKELDILAFRPVKDRILDVLRELPERFSDVDLVVLYQGLKERQKMNGILLGPRE